MSKTIHIGTISGEDALLKSKGKLNRNDDIVKAGVGVFVPKKHKKRAKQNSKNELREYYK